MTDYLYKCVTCGREFYTSEELRLPAFVAHKGLIEVNEMGGASHNLTGFDCNGEVYIYYRIPIVIIK